MPCHRGGHARHARFRTKSHLIVRGEWGARSMLRQKQLPRATSTSGTQEGRDATPTQCAALRKAQEEHGARTAVPTDSTPLAGASSRLECRAVRRSTVRISTVLAGSLVTIGLFACGGSSSAPSAPPTGSSGGAVAWVGNNPITKASLDHRIAIDALANREPVPDPPTYTACIHIQATAATPTPGKGRHRPTNTQLKSRCQELYETLRQQALGFLISAQWLNGEATEDGLQVSEQEAKQQYQQVKSRLYPSEAALQRLLASTGQTVPDLLLQLKLNEISNQIRRKIAASVGSVTHADVARYYHENKSRFAVPERRDLEIIRTASKKEASQAEKAIRSGEGFASAVKHVKIVQPIGAEHGLLMGLTRHLFSEQELDTPIFTAKPNVLTGPVKTTLGYYLFEVKTIRPDYQRTLAQVTATIKRQLPAEMQQKALIAFIRAWRQKWLARTNCQAEYIVQKCRRFRPTRMTPPEDPLALD
jgi:foldase protein PrsA